MFQVAEVVLQEGQTFDFSVIMQLLTILSCMAPDKLKGFMRIDPFYLIDSSVSLILLLLPVGNYLHSRYTGHLQMLLVPTPNGYLLFELMLDPYCKVLSLNCLAAEILRIVIHVHIYVRILFLATGISEPLSSSACASALRKFCEDASAVICEPSNLEILMWIGEVNYVL
ncbi:hypothetical protein CK203_014955 [Vitis vinifera]|uniref:Uncharacterized protein n=1 Tax=Vitis vinifera TaxID=29760 RepID=A0A438JDC3_VITVI|nr:hypothetical protein CK203_014955 [Vitis vinifera]